ncbi:hypothetical protein DXG03_003333, partial [Asterophora parasitica]
LTLISRRRALHSLTAMITRSWSSTTRRIWVTVMGRRGQTLTPAATRGRPPSSHRCITALPLGLLCVRIIVMLFVRQLTAPF